MLTFTFISVFAARPNSRVDESLSGMFSVSARPRALATPRRANRHRCAIKPEIPIGRGRARSARLLSNASWLWSMSSSVKRRCAREAAHNSCGTLLNAQRKLCESSNVPGIYRLSAACLTQLDRVDEAKTAFADFLCLVRDANVASTKAQIPLKRPEDLERYIEALRTRQAIPRMSPDPVPTATSSTGRTSRAAPRRRP
jgi:hypothetical protein